MRDIEEVRKTDINGGHFDLYIDDINFTDFQYNSMLENDVCRLSDINPDSVKDESVFKKLKEVSNFLKEILQIISNGEGHVMFEGVRPFADKIIEYVNKDVTCLNKIGDKKFCYEDLLETILVRNMTIRLNKLDKFTTMDANEKIQSEFADIEKEYAEMMQIINRYKVVV